MRTAVVAALLLIVPGIAFSLSASQNKDAARGAGVSPFACNGSALTPEERTKHFDQMGPKLISLRKGVRELADGYEFEFPSDPATYRTLVNWVADERLCCPFFDLDVRAEREGGPLTLRVTGREGVKAFIQVDGADWLKK